jgi:hypothetical protein
MHDVAVQTTTVATMEAAAQRGFSGLPTILIDGRDPLINAETSPTFACRVYRSSVGLSGVPGLLDMRRALKEAADSARSS